MQKMLLRQTECTVVRVHANFAEICLTGGSARSIDPFSVMCSNGNGNWRELGSSDGRVTCQCSVYRDGGDGRWMGSMVFSMVAAGRTSEWFPQCSIG